MQERLLVIGGGHPQLTLIEEGIKLGAHTIVIDNRPDCPGHQTAHEVICLDRYDADSILGRAPDMNLTAVVSGGSDKAVWVMARCADKCGLPSYVPVDVALMPMKKDEMRSFFERLNLPVPGSRRAESLEQALSAASELGYPVVVKPVDGIGQLGVNRIDEPSQLKEFYPQAQSASQSRSILVQEFIEGRELGVNGFVVDGEFRLLTLAYRDASKVEGDAFGVALYKQYPAEEAQPHSELIRGIIDRACKALAIRNAPIYAQLMLCEDKKNPIRIIEMMPRLGGGEDPRLVHAATGFNIAKATVLAALGKRIRDEDVIDAPSHPAVSIRFLTAPPGRITSIDGLDRARTANGIKKAETFYGVGHVLGDLRSSRDRIGYVLAVGNNLVEANQRALAAAQQISITT